MAEGKKKNKRRGPDFIVKCIQGSALVSWIIIFVILIVFSMAKPRFQGFGRNFAVVGGGGWDTALVGSIFYILIFQLVLCIVGLVISTTRMRRKSDRYNKSLIIMGILSVIGIAIFTVIR